MTTEQAWICTMCGMRNPCWKHDKVPDLNLGKRPKSARRSAYGFQKDIEVIEIHVDPPQAQGFGHTVYCDECGYDERMLSGPGAREIAQYHLHEHIMVVDNSDQW